MTTPKPKLDLFNESPFLVAKKCRTSTPSLRPPKPPTKSSKHMNRSRHSNSSSFITPTTTTTSSYTTTTTTTATNTNDNNYQIHDGSFSFGLLNSNNNNIGDIDQHTSRLSQQFEIICKIGSGYFADVYKVKSHLDGQYYAIKKTSIPYTSNSDRLRKLQEVTNHQSIPPHPNCVKYYDSWEEDGYLYIQTELCKISLNEILESSEEHKLPEHIVWSYLIDLLLAVKHLHDNQLLHLDIKPDNILISFEGVAKLGDFGIMCKCQDLNSSSIHQPSHLSSNRHTQRRTRKNFLDLSSTTIPTNTADISIFDDDDATAADTIFEDDDDESFKLPNDHNDSGIINRSDESLDSIDEGDSKYLASETMQGKFTKAADIFCLGITMFEVASGLDLPQRGEVYHKLRHNEIEDLYFNGLSADLVKIIKMMMEEDYTKRPTVDQLLQLDSVKIRQLSQTRPLSSPCSSSMSSSSS